MTGDYQNNNCGTLTVSNADLNSTASINLGGNWGGQNTTGFVYTYPYPYTPPVSTTYYWPTYENTAHAQRIAELEGEVKVLREMVAALVGGQNKPKARRARKV